MVSVGYLIGSPLAGHLSDTVLHSRKKVVASGFFLFGLVMLPFLFPSRLPLSGWYLIFGAIGLFSSTSPVNFAHAKELFPSRMTGTVLTGANFFVILGAASGSQVTGCLYLLVKDTGKRQTGQVSGSGGRRAAPRAMQGVIHAKGN